MTSKNKEFVTINRSTTGIRDFIFDEMERLANGQSDVERLKAMSKAGDTILKSAALDISVKKMINEQSQGRDQPKAVADMNLNIMLSDQVKHDDGV